MSENPAPLRAQPDKLSYSFRFPAALAIAAGNSSGINTTRTPSLAIALRGIPSAAHVAGFCANVHAPALNNARIPSAPSLPMPVRITPITAEPKWIAAERNRMSAEGRW